MNNISLRLLGSCIVILLSIVGSVAQSQSELNEQGCAKYKKTDARMNAVYQQVLTEYKQDSLFVAKLKTAQRAWLAFREAHVESLYPKPDKRLAYGSVNPMCVCEVLAELTAERTKALKKWVDGIEEGDVCSGSVRIRR
jgi:uncharacterized protein YecT (DUF1311 family)